MKVPEFLDHVYASECAGNHVLSGAIVVLLLIILIHAVFKLWEFSARPTNFCRSDLFETLYPGVVSYTKLFELIKSFQVDVGANSVLVTSFCTCDCNCNSSRHELSRMFLRTHTLGGLSGVPFDGTKAFIEILSGIPSGGSCFLLYGPHVNVNAQAFENASGDGCAFKRYGGCVGAINAVAFVWEKSDGNDTRTPSVVSDSEQFFLNQMLLAHSQDFQMPSESSIELPLVLFDFQTALINRFIAKGFRHIRADQLIVVVGGIQFNTPHGYSDCFLPLRIEVMNHHGTSKLSEELRWAKNGQ